MALKQVNAQLILKFIGEINPSGSGRIKDAKTDLFDVGALDSYSVVQLIQAFEERLEIIFDFSDLSAENFRNLETLVKLLVRKYDCTMIGA